MKKYSLILTFIILFVSGLCFSAEIYNSGQIKKDNKVSSPSFNRVVASGTLSNPRLDFSTNAFVWDSVIDLSSYAGTDGSSTPYKITLTDGSDRTATAWLGSEGGGEALDAEALTDFEQNITTTPDDKVTISSISAANPPIYTPTNGTDLLSGWDLTAGWTTQAATISDANTFVTTASSGWVRPGTPSLAINYRYSIVVDIDVSAGTWDLFWYDGSYHSVASAGDGTYYFSTTATCNGYLHVRASNSGVTVDINTLELYSLSPIIGTFVVAGPTECLSAEIATGNPVSGTMYVITARDDADFTADGAADNNVGTYYTSNGSGLTLDAGDKVKKVLPIGHGETVSLDTGTGWTDNTIPLHTDPDLDMSEAAAAISDGYLVEVGNSDWTGLGDYAGPQFDVGNDGEEISSGTLTNNQLYFVTATEVDHFGSGVTQYEFFTSNGTETCDANNKVFEIDETYIQWNGDQSSAVTITQTGVFTDAALNKIVLPLTRTAGSFNYNCGTNAGTSRSTSDTFTEYDVNAGDTSFDLVGDSSFEGKVTSSTLSAKRVTDCAATGLHGYTTRGGSTRGWDEESGFDRNASSYTYAIYR